MTAGELVVLLVLLGLSLSALFLRIRHPAVMTRFSRLLGLLRNQDDR
ncbi:MAG: hypothetical protein U1D96_10135 [Eubacteriales bacterium]|nr:hypothetical protein [Bacillota bacterium]MBV1727108.1 hypothetical protein [Desulforudis sp.]MDZ4043818.1 hypothetical protein [Eubacteriales bacterium]MBU4553556.1 hypothetical protein [Bacillota bacterium]MBV1735261.1 hypothetical protein [Desulforudis sp.]